MVEMRYEGYGPGGVAILVDCLSDNKNRTVSEVRHAFTKFGGNLGTEGSVAYLFENQGEILLSANMPVDKAMDVAIEAGASDVSEEEGQVEITTPVDQYHAVLAALSAAGLEIEQAHLTMHAQVRVPLDNDSSETLNKLVDMLEDLDDVQTVYCNADYALDPQNSEIQ